MCDDKWEKKDMCWWGMRHEYTDALKSKNDEIVKTMLSNFVLFVLRLSAAAKQYYMVEQTDFPSSALSSIWLN